MATLTPRKGAVRRGPRAAAGRRVALALTALGAVVVLAAVVLGVYSLAAGGDDGTESTPPVTRSVLPKDVDSPRLGVGLTVPAGWRRLPGKETLRFASPDTGMAVSVTAAAPTLSRPEVRERALGEIARAHPGLRLLREGDRVIGGLPAKTAELAGRTAGGETIRVLVASVRSSWRTYAITVLSRPTPERRRAVEAALMLRSLRLSKPAA